MARGWYSFHPPHLGSVNSRLTNSLASRLGWRAQQPEPLDCRLVRWIVTSSIGGYPDSLSKTGELSNNGSQSPVARGRAETLGFPRSNVSHGKRERQWLPPFQRQVRSREFASAFTWSSKSCRHHDQRQHARQAFVRRRRCPGPAPRSALGARDRRRGHDRRGLGRDHAARISIRLPSSPPT